MEDDRVLYSAYPGLNRVAMVKGIPLIPALAIVGVSVMACLIGGFTLGPGGLLLLGIGIPIWLGLRYICETDDQALRIGWLDFRCFLDRKRVALFGKSYTLAPMQYGMSLDTYTRALMREPDMALFESFREQLLAEKEVDDGDEA
ncbi:type IV secretion system protein VirB3 [Burkholderia territorii]|uniref:VirB3 family type IV secretion system protein n=1 Tax=Burkholderia territorii TaxID=1503055 RepID=UPI0007584BC0|nr:VirB3 family type IV secretion system protein [Burkholderia territorii]KVL25460.1 type IV secretion system protein VirB3 [Burkholderia territorii]